MRTGSCEVLCLFFFHDTKEVACIPGLPLTIRWHLIDSRHTEILRQRLKQKKAALQLRLQL